MVMKTILKPGRSGPIISSIGAALIIMCLMLGLPGCGGGGSSTGGGGGGPTLTSLQVTPANSTIVVGSTQQFTASGTFSDGSKKDLTSSASWSSSKTAVATISKSGLATSTTIGRVQISASSGSVTGSTTLIVVVGTAATPSRFAYAANFLDDTVSIYTVDGASGQLRPNGYALLVCPGAHAHACGSFSITVGPSSKFAYVANVTDGSLSVFSINSGTGELTSVPGSPFALASASEFPFAAVDPSGEFVYVSSGPEISAFTIDHTTGTLTPIPGSPFSAGTATSGVSVDPSGKF